jgi:hypothetical protein
MITLRLMQDFHGPEEKPPHSKHGCLVPQDPTACTPPTSNTLTFQTPEGAVLALMLSAKSHCQCSTHERRPKTFASKPT